MRSKVSCDLVTYAGEREACLAGVPNIPRESVILTPPRSAGVNGLAVDLQPLPEVCQSLLEDWRDDAVTVRANIEEHVASTAHRRHQVVQDLLQAQHVGLHHVAAVAPAPPGKQRGP